MSRLVLIFLLVCNTVARLAAQTTLDFYVYNELTKEPISEAHVFFVNTAKGTFSDAMGACSLELTKGLFQKELIISHVAYDTKLIEPHELSYLSAGDTIWLAPNQIEIDELIVQSTRNASIAF